MIDETSFPKAGEGSLGVARKYCGALGKVDNCQVAMSLHWSNAQMSGPLLWRHYLPKVWLEDATRRAVDKIPEGLGIPKHKRTGPGVGRSSRAWE